MTVRHFRAYFYHYWRLPLSISAGVLAAILGVSGWSVYYSARASTESQAVRVGTEYPAGVTQALEADASAADEFMVFAWSDGVHPPLRTATPKPPIPTIDTAHADGCTATGSLFAIDQATPLHHQPWQEWQASTQLFRPVGNANLSLILSPNRSHYESRDGLPALRCQGPAQECSGFYVDSPDWFWPLAVRFSPAQHDIVAMLARRYDTVPTTDGTSRWAQSLYTYDITQIDWDRPPKILDQHRYALLGPSVASYYIGQDRDIHRWILTKLLYSPDGTELLVLGFDGEVGYSNGALIRVDTTSMSEVRAAIPFDANFAQYGALLERPTYWRNDVVTNMDIDPTGRFVVFNRWETATIGVIDLETEESWTLPVLGFERDEDYLVLEGNAVANVSFNKTEFNRGLLAIHGLDRVGVYELSDDGRSLQLIDLEHVARGLIYRKDGPGGPVPRGSAFGAIDWTGDGRYLVAVGAAEGPDEIHSWQISKGDGQMLDHHTYEACTEGYNWVDGLVTLNGLIPTSTPTPTRTGEPRPRRLHRPSRLARRRPPAPRQAPRRHRARHPTGHTCPCFSARSAYSRASCSTWRS